MQEVEFLVVTFLRTRSSITICSALGSRTAPSRRNALGRSRRFRRGPGIAAGEQRDIVSQTLPVPRQPVHDPFGAAVEFGGQPRQRGNLRDAHSPFLCLLSSEQSPQPLAGTRHADRGTFPHLRSSLVCRCFFLPPHCCLAEPSREQVSGCADAARLCAVMARPPK